MSVDAKFCPAMFEELPDGRFMGSIHLAHEEGVPGRRVTVPIVGGGAVRILLCKEHADLLSERYASAGEVRRG